MRFNTVDSNEFKDFAKALKLHMPTKKMNKAEFNNNQREQVEKLLKLEEEFRKNIINTPLGYRVYMEFIKWIVYDKRNILTARPYFRERQKIFSDNISPAIKDEDVEILFKYHINYQLIHFFKKRAKFYPGSTLFKLENEIRELRHEIVQLNLPLAINRARVFYSRTQRAHLSYMDIIETAVVGLLHGIDKYSPGDREVDTKMFRSTVIGVMGGNFIETASQTVLHFFPQDKRKLYRANKAVGRFGGTVSDYEKIAEMVNEGVGDPETHDFIKNPTDATEIADLLAAATTISSDSLTNKNAAGFEDLPDPVTRFQAPDSCRPDIQLEEKYDIKTLMTAMSKLSIFEQKLLRLTGIRGNLV